MAVYDAMREAGTALMGSFVWLADHAADEGTAARWWADYGEVQRPASWSTRETSRPSAGLPGSTWPASRLCARWCVRERMGAGSGVA